MEEEESEAELEENDLFFRQLAPFSSSSSSPGCEVGGPLVDTVMVYDVGAFGGPWWSPTFSSASGLLELLFG